jgi:WhiB family redox-sensing transcriptional regulator
MLHELADQPEWMADARCPQVGSDLFYADDLTGVQAALEVCRRCPVRDDCLDHALDTGEIYGVWGGTSETARGKLRVRMRRELGLQRYDPLPPGCGPRARQLGLVPALAGAA